MRIIKIIKKLISEKNEHFISVDSSVYKRYKYLIKIAISFNNKYKPCEIRREKFKSLRKFVVVGLRYSGKNVKRRTTGYAKTFLNTHYEPKCLYCQSVLNSDNATADHIVPISKGGNNCQVNLIVVCNGCNSERGNTEFNEFLKRKNNIDIKTLYY